MAKEASTRPVPKVLSEARKIEDSLRSLQDSLAEQVVEGKTEDGRVKVKLTGAFGLKKVLISPSLIDPEDRKGLEKAVEEALANALHEARLLMARKTAAVVNDGLNAVEEAE
jgi:DNA-binding YbaB/EbfC family protein